MRFKNLFITLFITIASWALGKCCLLHMYEPEFPDELMDEFKENHSKLGEY